MEFDKEIKIELAKKLIIRCNILSVEFFWEVQKNEEDVY